ncbi:MAG: ABC transporter ATP-binding protein [Gordonia sp. (in: high G+C Gram-positive bacteria)]|uniref:ABC transporter ATP-binding protein n=1 Tax=Gordonia sp. (in: high G+C Gram-positive bacteria) TaxID=84139 RepID=UPI0039E247CE
MRPLLSEEHPLITVDNVRKSISGRTIWDEVSFSVPSGSMVALIGESGSGKSTLMNCIGCIDSVDSGTIVVDGTAVTGLGARGLRRVRANSIGYLFQDFALIENESVYENIRIGVRGRVSRKTFRALADEMLTRVGLEGRGGDKVHRLSGGQQQRVALARVLARRPTVVLADEPTAALDRGNSEMVVRSLRALAESGASVLVASHVRWVVDHCDAVVSLTEGAGFSEVLSSS